MASEPRRRLSGLDHADRQKILLALAAGVLVMLLGLNLGERELWTDEVFSLQAGLQPLEVSLADASHPPGYYYLLHHWLKASSSDGWLRTFSVLWALVAWVLFWLIAGELDLRREGLVALWLMALSPLIMLYCRLGRYYSLAMAATLLALWLMLRVLRQPTWLHALLLALAVVVVAYTDYIALMVVLLALLIHAAGAWGRWERPAAWWLLSGGAAGLVGALPILLRLVRDTSKVAAISPDPLAHSLWGLAVKLAFPLYGLATGECIDPWRLWVSVPAVLLVAGLLVWGFAAMCQQGPLARVTACLFPLNLLLAAGSLSSVAANVPPNRVTSLAMCTLPLAYLVMARGLVQLGSLRRLLPAVALLGCIYGYGLYNYYAREQLLNPGYAPPWRAAAPIIQERDQRGDSLIVLDDGFIRYYSGRARLLHLEVVEWIRLGKSLPEGRVWLVTRDRGSVAMMDEGEQIRQRLLQAGFAEQVFPVMPRTAWEQRMRTLVLRRPAWDAYVKVYLLQRQGTATLRTP